MGRQCSKQLWKAPFKGTTQLFLFLSLLSSTLSLSLLVAASVCFLLPRWVHLGDFSVVWRQKKWGSGKLVSRVCAEVHDLGLKRSMRRRRSAQMGGEMGGGAPRRPKKGGGALRRSKMGGGAPRRPKMGGGAPRRLVKKQSTQNPPILLFNPKSRTSAQTLDTNLPEPQLTQCLC